MVEENAVQPVKIELEVLDTLDGKDVNSRKETEIDSQLIDGLINLVKSKDNFSSIKETPENVKDLYEVVFKPHLQEGIDSGNLEWNGVSAQIRNKRMGK